jgi:RNA polymerase sigma factor (sigma-70 family)
VEPPARSTETLLRRWQEAGDAEALDELLRAEVGLLKGRITARGRDLMGSSASASDIAQEAVLRMLQLDAVPHFENEKVLRSYLWVTAWRLLIQRIRRPYRNRKAIDFGASSQLPAELVAPAAPSDLGESATALEFAMNLLPPGDRDLIHQVHFEGRKVADLAREEGVAGSAVRMRLLRARRALAARLAAWEEVIG